MASGVSKQCSSRLQKEYRNLLKDPVPNISAHPSPTNILEWHFVLQGSKGTEFEGGVYHGKLTFPGQYPFKPPSICLTTPNGRFATNTKLCLSMTDFHPETWNPMWSVGTILTGLLSFMYDSQATTGSIVASTDEKRRLAAESLAYNVKKNVTFRKLFPEWVEIHNKREEEKNNPIPVPETKSVQGGETDQTSSTSLPKRMPSNANGEAPSDHDSAGSSGAGAGEAGRVLGAKGENLDELAAQNGGAPRRAGNYCSSSLAALAFAFVILAVVVSPFCSDEFRRWFGSATQ